MTNPWAALGCGTRDSITLEKETNAEPASFKLADANYRNLLQSHIFAKIMTSISLNIFVL